MTPSDIFWAVVFTCAALSIGGMLCLLIWVLAQSVVPKRNPVEWTCDNPGVDVLGDGGRRLD
jgi:hypothetical protein